jgi:hypothetical protein
VATVAHNSNSDTHANSYTHSNSNSDSDTNSYFYTEPNPYSHTDGYSRSNSNPTSNSDTNSDRYPDSNADTGPTFQYFFANKRSDGRSSCDQRIYHSGKSAQEDPGPSRRPFFEI